MSGPEYGGPPADRWRRRCDTELERNVFNGELPGHQPPSVKDALVEARDVDCNELVRGFSRRVEGQCRADWSALPIMRSMAAKHSGAHDARPGALRNEAGSQHRFERERIRAGVQEVGASLAPWLRRRGTAPRAGGGRHHQASIRQRSYQAGEKIGLGAELHCTAHARHAAGTTAHGPHSVRS